MCFNSAVWFKVQEDGRDGTSDTWGATAVMTAGGKVTYTVPECIESGAYLVRHEIIALHAAGTEGGGKFGAPLSRAAPPSTSLSAKTSMLTVLGK